MKKKNSLRKILIKDIKNRLIKEFLDDGFEQVPLLDDEQSPEIKQAFAFGRLRRERGNDLELVEVQLDGHGRPMFIINCGIAPEKGVTTPWGAHYDKDKVSVGSLSNAYRLTPSTFKVLEFWFKLGIFSPKNEQSVKILVNRAIFLTKEIKEWFKSGKVGRHMRETGIGEAPFTPPPA